MLFYALLIAYGTIATLFILALLRQHSKEEESVAALQQTFDEITDPVKKCETTMQFIKLRREHRPWFERSLSSIGVVGFMSMTVAAGISGVQATIQSGNTEALRKEVAALEKQKILADRIMDNATDTVLTQFARHRYLSNFDMKTLSYRLATIDDALFDGRSLSKEERLALLRQKYEIHFALDDPQEAARVFEENMDIAESSLPEDQIFLAESLAIKHFKEKALAILDEVDENSTQLDLTWEARALKIRAYLDDANREEFGRMLSGILQVPIEEAQKQLARAVDQYEKTAERLAAQKRGREEVDDEEY